MPGIWARLWPGKSHGLFAHSQNIYAPLTPCKPEGQMATRQRRERNPLWDSGALGLGSLGKEACRLTGSGSLTC